VTAAARRPLRDDDAPARRLPAWAVSLARGLLIAVPILLVFTALFASADAVFATLTAHLFDWNVDVGQLPIRFAVGFLIAWVVAGLLAVAAGDLQPWWDGEPDEPRPQSLGAAAASDPLGRGFVPTLGSIEALTVLVAVDVLFAVFVVLQLAYLFGGLSTLEATGLPYAEYARSGFFELVAVAVLAGGLLATIHAVAARRTTALVAAGLVLAGLTAVVLASALLRLRIYQDAYGWTELRFYVLATIAWLAIGIAITAVLLVRDRMAWLLHGLGIAAIVVLVGINVVGPSRLIATENVARLLDPARVPADGRTGPRRRLRPGPRRRRRARPRHCSAGPRSAGSRRPSWNPPRPAGRAGAAGGDRLAGVEPGSVAGPGCPGGSAAELTLPGRPRRPGPTLGRCTCPSSHPSSRCSPRPPTACPRRRLALRAEVGRFRAIVFRDGDEVFIQSRDLKPLDRYFPELAEPLRRSCRSAASSTARSSSPRTASSSSSRSCSGSIPPHRG
jgi:hypothetical protein